MLKKTIFFFMTVVFVSLVFTPIYAQEDVEGSEDHPMISRLRALLLRATSIMITTDLC